MKRELGWFRIGSGLVVSLLLLIVLPACSRPFIEVTVGAQCEPKGEKNPSPEGPPTPLCNKDGNGCLLRTDGKPCTCR